MKSALLALGFLMAAQACADSKGSSTMSTQAKGEGAAAQRATRQLLVAFQTLPEVAERETLWKKYSLKEIEQVGKNPLILVEAPEGTDSVKLAEIRKQLASEKGVRYA